MTHQHHRCSIACQLFLAALLLMGTGCRQQKLLFKPMVINRAQLHQTFKDAGTGEIIFQNVYEQSGHQNPQFSLAGYSAMGRSTFKNLPADTFFVPWLGSPTTVTIKTGKKIEHLFGNFVLPRGKIPADTLPDYPYILLYPALLNGDARYVQYNVYYALYPSSEPGRAGAASRSAGPAPVQSREIVFAQFSLNPSPPRRYD